MKISASERPFCRKPGAELRLHLLDPQWFFASRVLCPDSWCLSCIGGALRLDNEAFDPAPPWIGKRVAGKQSFAAKVEHRYSAKGHQTATSFSSGKKPSGGFALLMIVAHLLLLTGPRGGAL
jgi:hypothetical protein